MTQTTYDNAHRLPFPRPGAPVVTTAVAASHEPPRAGGASIIGRPDPAPVQTTHDLQPHQHTPYERGLIAGAADPDRVRGWVDASLNDAVILTAPTVRRLRLLLAETGAEVTISRKRFLRQEIARILGEAIL